MRSSHPGSHQLARPEQAHRRRHEHHAHERGVEEHGDGEAERRTSCTLGSSPRTKAPNTLIMISAAEVMTRAVLERPSTTASWLSPVATYSSRTRDRRNTS